MTAAAASKPAPRSRSPLPRRTDDRWGSGAREPVTRGLEPRLGAHPATGRVARAAAEDLVDVPRTRGARPLDVHAEGTGLGEGDDAAGRGTWRRSGGPAGCR